MPKTPACTVVRGLATSSYPVVDLFAGAGGLSEDNRAPAALTEGIFIYSPNCPGGLQSRWLPSP